MKVLSVVTVNLGRALLAGPRTTAPVDALKVAP